jgi:molybdate transport system permease protein
VTLRRYVPGIGWWLGLPLGLFLVVPMVVLLMSVGPGALVEALRHPMAADAIRLSIQTTFVSLGIVLVAGTPLAWQIARSQSRIARLVETLVELPIVIPPAVVGVALLQTYGRRGAIGPLLEEFGIRMPFTTAAVVTAQVIVSAPFFVQAATAGFRRIDQNQLLVAQTLGATPLRAFFTIAIPAALPGLVGGAALCWARALGEFGATLFFAGNMQGRTQTMPLAIFAALEADIGLANALALVLGIAAFVVLFALRVLPTLRGGRTSQNGGGR